MSEVEQVTFFQLTFDPIDSVFKIKVTLMGFLSCNAQNVTRLPWLGNSKLQFS